ncbi:hypothetical protein GCM10009601_04210 [Streptomyces thermospinosisporus]|uniref:MFS transporter n=1 Tax=Streptomyces thermospinosisporus TaxID=161482 RepID=A0ABP4J7B1_9ACTN
MWRHGVPVREGAAPSPRVPWLDSGFCGTGPGVFNAYVIAFGGLLLLGGRLSDLFGARKIFNTGWPC